MTEEFLRKWPSEKKIENFFVLIQKSITQQIMASMTNSRYASEHFCEKQPTEPAIVIPRVFKNITQQRILAIFRKLDLGDIVRIDMVPRSNDSGEDYWRVFVHLAWGETENSLVVRTKLMDKHGNGEVKIVYDDPWFWKLHASRPAPAKVNTRRSRPAPFIDFQKDETKQQVVAGKRHMPEGNEDGPQKWPKQGEQTTNQSHKLGV